MSSMPLSRRQMAFGIVVLLLLVVVLGMLRVQSGWNFGTPTGGGMPREYPYLDCSIGCNQDVRPGPPQVNEVSVAVNPRNPMNIIAAANDYNDSTGAHWLGYYWSMDGGMTWGRNMMPGCPGCNESGPLSAYQHAGDPALAWDGQGNAYLAGLAWGRTSGSRLPNTPTSVVLVAKSTDGGKSYSQITYPALAYTQATFHDKEWIDVDKNTGNIYVSWTLYNVGALARIVFVRSTDGGQTWSRPQTLVELKQAELNVQGSWPLVGADGAVHVFWVDFSNNKLRIARSTDEGQTFTTPVDIADVNVPPDPLPNSDFRSSLLPSGAADLTSGNTSGSLYISWNDYRTGDSDALLVYSRDAGASWQGPVRVNNDPESNGADQFMPAVNVAGDGSVHVLFYDRRDDENNTLIRTYLASSPDGANFTKNFNVSDVQFNGNYGGTTTASPENHLIGDYIELAAGGDFVYGCWADTRYGTADTPNSDIFGARIQVVHPLVVR